MQLTKSFTLEEMLESQTARRHNITLQFKPPQEVVDNLKNLLTNVVEPLREELKCSIQISSGYRCPQTNKFVKGAPNSQHVVGQAADLQCPTLGNAALFNTIQQLKLPYDQLIWEFGTSKEPAWVHVSFGPRQRRQILYVGVKKNGAEPLKSVVTQLTPNFHLREFKCKDGTEVPEALLPNVKELAKSLQALRDKLGEPLHMLAGYRTEAYNQKIGEQNTSMHLQAKAADLSCKSKTPAQLASIVEGLVTANKMKEGGLGVYPGYIHYDIRGVKERW
ncbi:MAG: peptidase family protein [Segetibacter sp.]|nr:peptidase family protein [Segetibacter sp.]